MLFSCAVTDFEGGNAILLFNHYFNDSNFESVILFYI